MKIIICFCRYYFNLKVLVAAFFTTLLLKNKEVSNLTLPYFNKKWILITSLPPYYYEWLLIVSLLLFISLSNHTLSFQRRYFRNRREISSGPKFFIDYLFVFSFILLALNIHHKGIYNYDPVIFTCLLLISSTLVLISGLAGAIIKITTSLLKLFPYILRLPFILKTLTQIVFNIKAQLTCEVKESIKIHLEDLFILHLDKYLEELRCYSEFAGSLFSYYPYPKNKAKYEKEIHKKIISLLGDLSNAENGLSESDRIKRYIVNILIEVTGIEESSPFLSDSEGNLVDILNRETFLDRLFDSIVRHAKASKESFTIGLHGKWGEGKTHVINMLEDKISREVAKDFITVKVSAWSYINDENSVSNLINGLYSDIKKAITQEFYIPELDSAFSDYFNAITGLGFSSKVYGIPLSIRIFRSNKNKNTAAQSKARISQVIKEIDKKLLIIIDDIDRLHAKEILALLQAVRAHLDFNNTIFLLSYDPTEVKRQLKEEKVKDDYIHKIVQWEVKLPEFSNDKVTEYIRFELDEKRDELKLPKNNIIEQDDLYNALDNVFNLGSGSKFIYNLRHAKRLINSLTFNYPPVASEVNFSDFVKLEILKQNNSEIYFDIISNPKLYLGKNPYNEIDYMFSDKDTDKLKSETKAYIEEITKENLNIKRLLAELFPHVNESFERLTYSGNESDDKAIHNPKYFHRYFRDGLPEGQVKDTEIDAKLESWLSLKPDEAKVDLHEYFIEKKEEDKLVTFVSEIKERFTNDWEDKNIQKDDKSKIALLIVQEIYSYEQDYNDLAYRFTGSDFPYNTLTTFLYYLIPSKLKTEVPNIIKSLSFYRASRLAENFLYPEKSNMQDYLYKHKDKISKDDFKNIKAPIYERFQKDFIDEKVNLLEHEHGGYLWFMIQRDNKSLNLESYIKPFVLKSKEAFWHFIKFYLIFGDSFNKEAIDTFCYPELLEAMKKKFSDFEFTEEDATLVEAFFRYANEVIEKNIKS